MRGLTFWALLSDYDDGDVGSYLPEVQPVEKEPPFSEEEVMVIDMIDTVPGVCKCSKSCISSYFSHSRVLVSFSYTFEVDIMSNNALSFCECEASNEKDLCSPFFTSLSIMILILIQIVNTPYSRLLKWICPSHPLLD